jgi:AraC-like DNA-binding protein
VLNDDISRDWTLDELAAAVGTSRARLCARAQAQLGEGIFQYLQRLRMFEACRLLRESNFEIAKVARQVGYASQAAFITAFRRKFGATPNQYRSEQRRVDDSASPAFETSVKFLGAAKNARGKLS